MTAMTWSPTAQDSRVGKEEANGVGPTQGCQRQRTAECTNRYLKHAEPGMGLRDGDCTRAPARAPATTTNKRPQKQKRPKRTRVAQAMAQDDGGGVLLHGLECQQLIPLQATEGLMGSQVLNGGAVWGLLWAGKPGGWPPHTKKRAPWNLKNEWCGKGVTASPSHCSRCGPRCVHWPAQQTHKKESIFLSSTTHLGRRGRRGRAGLRQRRRQQGRHAWGPFSSVFLGEKNAQPHLTL